MKSKLAHIALVFGLIFTSLIGTFASPAKPVRAAVAAPQALWYTLTASKGAGNGTGTIVSSKNSTGLESINCDTSCSSDDMTVLAVSWTIYLTATASSDSAFTGWGGDCSSFGTSRYCHVLMNANRSAIANFTRIYTMTVAKNGNGAGTVTSVPSGIDCGATCNTTFQSGTVVTLTTSPNTGSQFTSWSGVCTGTGACVTTVTAAKNVTATFTLITYTVNAAKAGNGSGSITSAPAGISCGATCSTSYNYNTPITLTASADTGSTFTGWQGDCTANGSSCSTTVTGARNITATFTLITYTIAVTKTGNGSGGITSAPGSIDCGATCDTSFDYNTPVTLTAAADTGSYFTGWEGDCAADGLSCATTVTGTRDVTATFTLITYTVAVTKTGNGTGVITSTPGNIDCGATCDTSFDYNTPVTLTAAADTGSYFTGWEGDCAADGFSCATTVTGTRDVTATFTLITYTVSITKDGNGSGVITSTPGNIDCGETCDTNLDYNTPVTLTAAADTGSYFAGWQGDCTADGLSCTTTVTGTRDVTATFTLITYTVSVTKTGNGTGVITTTPDSIDCGATCDTSFDYNTVVTLTATPDIGSLLTGWEGDCTADGLSCTTTVTGTRNVTATFTLITYTVSVTKTGNGAGSITTDPSSIDCGGTCEAAFNHYTVITLTASADTGSTFTGWAGDCEADGLSCTTTVTGTRNVTATFTLITYTLSVTTTGTGSITSDPPGIDCGVTCSEAYDYNTVVTLTATPDTGYYLTGWEGDCSAVGLSCTTTVTGTRNVTATFGILTYTLSVAKSGSGSTYGTITSDPTGVDCGITCSTSYDYNTPITLTAAADTGSYLAAWEGDCTVDGLTCTTTMTGTRNVTATFTLITYTLSVTTSGVGTGSITSDPSGIDCGATCSEAYDYNTVVTLTATPNTGYYLVQWEGDCTADDLSCVSTITGTRNVTATFGILTYTLSVAKDGNGTSFGSVTSDPTGIDCGITCSMSYDYNTPVTLTASADTGAFFAGWTGDCTVDGLSCTTTMTDTRNVTATFTLITYTISVTKTGNGSGSIASDPTGIDCGTTCSGSFNYTSTVTLTATADTGSTFMGWTGDCIGTVPCNITIDAAKNVTATFSLVTYTLTMHKTGDGTGAVTSDPAGIDCGLTCTVAYDYGTVVTLTQQPITGSAFAGWQGDCTGSGTCQVTVLGNQSVTATFNLITTNLGVSQNVTRSMGTITFTVVVTNGGPADADGTIVSDTVSSEISNPQWHCQAANGASCPGAGLSLSMVSTSVFSLYAALPDFPAGGVVTYTISGNVGLLAQRLTNVVQIFAPTGVADVSQPDDSSSLISGYCVMFPVVIKRN